MARPRHRTRWADPCSPLQAARFARRLVGQTVVDGIRALCPGHRGRPCRMDVSRLSEYETGARRPGRTHIEAICRFYQRGPEDLGLITWRDVPNGTATMTPAGDSAPPDDPDPTGCACDHNGNPPPRLVLIWVHDKLDGETATLAAAVLWALAQDTTTSGGESVEDWE